MLVPFCRSLRESVALFRQSAFAKRAFGNDVVEHYAHFYDRCAAFNRTYHFHVFVFSCVLFTFSFRSEVKAFDKAVTDWERQRYFEQI